MGSDKRVHERSGQAVKAQGAGDLVRLGSDASVRRVPFFPGKVPDTVVVVWSSS
jgi:hypothetical protein